MAWKSGQRRNSLLQVFEIWGPTSYGSASLRAREENAWFLLEGGQRSEPAPPGCPPGVRGADAERGPPEVPARRGGLGIFLLTNLSG